MKVPTYTTVSPAPAEKLAGNTVPVPPPIARFYLGHYTAIPAKSVPEHSGCLSMCGARCTEHRKLSGVPGTPPPSRTPQTSRCSGRWSWSASGSPIRQPRVCQKAEELQRVFCCFWLVFCCMLCSVALQGGQTHPAKKTQDKTNTKHGAILQFLLHTRPLPFRPETDMPIK